MTTTLRSPRQEEWVPSPRTKTAMRASRTPREEYAKTPKLNDRVRPSPIRLLAPSTPPSVDSPPLPPKAANDARLEVVPDPEIVDLAVPSTWPRRAGPPVPPKSRLGRHMPSTSLYSRCSTTKDSEVSFGILDYYKRDPSPLPSPSLPTSPVPARKGDAAMEQFDFELTTTAPCIRGAVMNVGDKATPRVQRPASDLTDSEQPPHATPGAERTESMVAVSSPTRQTNSGSHARTYSLFPTVKETPTPAARAATSAAPQVRSPAMTTPSSTKSSPASIHQQPDPSYRPRKESLASSLRSRKDSFTSFRSNRRIPLRILSSGSTASAGGRTLSSASASTNPPPSQSHQSRWSDETITSPTVATTPGPRMSFGSLLQEINDEGSQYPACFFEDDDEAAPLRRKFAWKRSTSLTQKERQQAGQRSGRGRFDERTSFSYTLKRFMLCGGCGLGSRTTRCGTI